MTLANNYMSDTIEKSTFAINRPYSIRCFQEEVISKTTVKKLYRGVHLNAWGIFQCFISFCAVEKKAQ